MVFCHLSILFNFIKISHRFDPGLLIRSLRGRNLAQFPVQEFTREKQGGGKMSDQIDSTNITGPSSHRPEVGGGWNKAFSEAIDLTTQCAGHAAAMMNNRVRARRETRRIRYLHCQTIHGQPVFPTTASLLSFVIFSPPPHFGGMPRWISLSFSCAAWKLDQSSCWTSQCSLLFFIPTLHTSFHFKTAHPTWFLVGKSPSKGNSEWPFYPIGEWGSCNLSTGHHPTSDEIGFSSSSASPLCSVSRTVVKFKFSNPLIHTSLFAVAVGNVIRPHGWP